MAKVPRILWGSLSLVLCNVSLLCSAFISDVGEICLENSTDLNLTCDPSIPLHCINGRCQCAKGYTISTNGSRCLEISRGINSTCSESIQCWKSIGRLSHCVHGRCTCYDSETLSIVYHQGRCYYGELIGDLCQIDGLCSATTQNAVCDNKMCSCRNGYVPNWDHRTCLKIADGLDDDCIENVQCERSSLGPLSECSEVEKKCKCFALDSLPTVFYMGKCFFAASLGDSCELNAQCLAKTPGASCIHGKCEIEQEDSSDSSCSDDGQCILALGYFSRCNSTTRSCECTIPPSSNETSRELTSRFAGSKCYSLKTLGEPCLFSKQCSIQTSNSLCSPHDGVCICSPSHVQGHREEDGIAKCLPIASNGLDSPCRVDEQCRRSSLGPLAICNRRLRRCGCSGSSSNANPILYFEGKCVVHRRIGEICGSREECQSGNNLYADCIGGECGCIEGLKASNQTCTPMSNALESSSSSSSSSPFLKNTLKLIPIFLTSVLMLCEI